MFRTARLAFLQPPLAAFSMGNVEKVAPGVGPLFEALAGLYGLLDGEARA